MKTNKFKEKSAELNLKRLAAEQLIDEGSLTVGLVSCLVKKKVAVKRFFNCLKLGHIAQDCTSPENICLNCGKIEHLSKTSENKRVQGEESRDID